MLNPFPYQAESIDKVLREFRAGVRRQLGQAATGMGKTVIFAHLAARIGGRTLILAHRDELLDQAEEKLLNTWPEAAGRIGRVAAERNEVAADIVLASVQTLARPERLEQLPRNWDLIVVDEAHHAAAASYRRILSYLLPEDMSFDARLRHPLLLGVTATPNRSDGIGLEGIFEKITFQWPLEWGIRHGYLSDLRGMRVGIPVDLDDLPMTRRSGEKDWDETALGEALMAAGAPEHVVRAWREHAAERPTLVFAPTVTMSKAIADRFAAAGVRAAHVDGTMSKAERKSILDAYRRREIDVLCNCMILTEGVDLPHTSCVVIARPTRSGVLYSQMVGRGVRKHPDKQDCLILDLVGATETNGLWTLPTLVGLPPELLDGGRRSVSEAQDEHERRRAEAEARAAEERELAARQAALFRVARSRLHWIRLPNTEAPAWALPLGAMDGGDESATAVMAEIKAGEETRYVAWILRRNRHPQKIAEHHDMGLVQGTVEDLARRMAARLAANDVLWRGKPVSDGQARLLAKWGISTEHLTRGQASDIITATVAGWELRRYQLVPVRRSRPVLSAAADRF